MIATMHGKEEVIAPILEKELGVIVERIDGFDTDRFGTFSGEVERKLDPLETARKKCSAASEQYNCSLAVASEGSFGPHPSMFFVPADDEIVVLKDFENNLEIKARLITTQTNFNSGVMTNWQEVERFANMVHFPSHALIAKQSKNGLVIAKGITKWDDLKTNVEESISAYRQVFVETDMRAMHNPTRMQVIRDATLKLIDTIKHVCPDCEAPGFDVVSVIEGLPCELCGWPTRSTLAYVLNCQKCNYSEERRYPHHKTKESAMYCDRCNP